MRKIDEIIIHCSATPEGRDVSAKEIDRWHRERGFRCIGYHFVIRLDGTVETGRKVSEMGAHCYGRNYHSIGVCYIGGYDKNGNAADTRTDAQKTALLELLKKLVSEYRPVQIVGHNRYAYKDCPCFDAFKEYNHLCSDI